MNLADARFQRTAYLVCALAVLLAAAFARFRLPQTPFCDEDSWGYFNPALVKLTGGIFEHNQSREFLYPAFLFVNLCACGDFRAVGVSQHALGLLAGVFLLLAWEELGACCLPRAGVPRVPGPVRAGLGLGLAGVYSSATRSRRTSPRDARRPTIPPGSGRSSTGSSIA